MCAESSTRVPGDMGDGVDVAVAWGDKAAAAQKKRAMARAGDVASASKAANRLPLALRCGGSIVRIVQAQRATFYCPACQPRQPGRRRKERSSGGAPGRKTVG